MNVRYRQLTGLRIFVLEDEMLIAMQIEDILRDLGCVIVGVTGNLDEAIATIGAGSLDGALLDTNLHGRSSSPAAEELLRRRVPFVLVTGYSDGDIGAGPLATAAARVRKPFSLAHLADGMMAAFVSSKETVA